MLSLQYGRSWLSAPRQSRRWSKTANQAYLETLERRVLLTSLVVNTIADSTDLPGSGVVSLRDAVAAANASATPTTITFSPTVFATPHTINLSGTPLTLSNTAQPTTITGPAAGVTVNGNTLWTTFTINGNVTAILTGLTTLGNATTNPSAPPEGIINGGNVTLTNDTFAGGGIENTAAMTLNNITISGFVGYGITNQIGAVVTINTASISGVAANSSYGIYNNGTVTLNEVSIFYVNSGMLNTGTVTASNLTISGNLVESGIINSGNLTLNTATVAGVVGKFDLSEGGGIRNLGNASITNATIANNTLIGNDTLGGGFYNAGNATLTGVTISGNDLSGAYGYGGGIYNQGTLTLVNSTIADNTADGGNIAGTAAGGGGIYNAVAGNASLYDDTIADNSVPGAAGTDSGGGGIANAAVAGNFTIANTIVAGDTVTNLGPDLVGSVHSLGHNLFGITTGGGGWIAADLIGNAASPLNAKLGILVGNGGPMQTLLPQPGSPAIAAGSIALIPSGISTDQRGLPRLVNGTVDIGAVEVQPVVEEPVYRLYSPVTLEHLYTTDLNEYDTLQQYTGSWNAEGQVFSVYSGPTTVDGVADEPLYRLYDSADKQHFWTDSYNEYNTLKNAPWNWNDEGIVGYVFPTAIASSIPLYRMMAPQVHLWTTDVNEYDTLVGQGWTQEGIIGYVL